ncbi:hypothetical protein Hypma_013991 [Hypsizygus marmoreus]|uniref:Uncharacterized protein n=1 Tax=Hypsizygus marmoreus TaxID=39966 RepID=A0A369K8K9_HYPMA|nr:hypothetical protein Hypma_013991 [Hypsizygus marmoreus]
MSVDSASHSDLHRDLLQTLILRAKFPSRIHEDHPQLKPPFEIEELATNADNGSIKDLRTLAASLQTDATLSHYPEILDILFRHVEASPPPSVNAANTNDDVELAEASLHCIFMAMQCHVSSGCMQVEGSLLASKVLLSWPMLWEWMKYLYYWTGNDFDFSFDAES